MRASLTHARPRWESKRVLLTCPLSQRYCTSTTYDVEVPNNIISSAQTLRQGSPVLSATTPAKLLPAVSCGLRSTVLYLGHAVWITCTVSANGP